MRFVTQSYKNAIFLIEIESESTFTLKNHAHCDYIYILTAKYFSQMNIARDPNKVNKMSMFVAFTRIYQTSSNSVFHIIIFFIITFSFKHS